MSGSPGIGYVIALATLYHSPQWVERNGRWYFEREQGAHADRGHDGIPDRYDRDRDNDGVQNRYDRSPDNPRRY